MMNLMRNSWPIFISLFLTTSIYAFDRDFCPTFCNQNLCENFSFNAAWLYWKVNGDDFDFAVEKVSNGASEEGFFSGRAEEESFHDLKFDWDSGFRLGFGYDSPRYCWGIALDWTHFDTSSHRHFTAFGSQVDRVSVAIPYIDMTTPTLGPDDTARILGGLNFRYNVVDLEIGKWLLCGDSCCFMFRPHVGLRFANIQEKLKNRFETALFNFDQQGGTLAIDTRFSTKNHFKGVGLRAGLDADLCLCKGLSFIGRSAVSLIWGHTKLKSHRESFADVMEQVTNHLHGDTFVKEHYKQTRVITDLSLGIRYQMVACECYPLTLEASWEHHYLFGQHRFWDEDTTPDFSSTPLKATTSWKNKGLLALQGLTLSAWLIY